MSRHNLAPISRLNRPRRIKAAFQLGQEFYDELARRLEQIRLQANNSRRQMWSSLKWGGWLFANRDAYARSAVPENSHLKRIVEGAFWASLKKEEGRSLVFSIGYEDISPLDTLTISLAESLPFTVENLVKLAPAAGKFGARFSVAAPEGEPLQIRGIATMSTAPFIVEILDPGLLVIKFAAENVAIISGNEATFIRNRLLSHSSSIWSKLDGSKNSSEYNAFADVRVDIILGMLRTIRRLGHGGTLLLVSSASNWRTSIDHIKYPVKAGFTELKQIVADVESDKADDERLKASRRWMLDTLADNVAQLTAVDGATVVSHHLVLIGFGAMIKETDLSFDVVEIDPLDHEDYINRSSAQKIGNKRHQSAARFVHEQKDAIALVVSQDGNVTAFVWEEHDDKPHLSGLRAYRRLELTLF